MPVPKVARVDYKRLGKYRDVARMYEYTSLESLQATMEDDVKNVLNGKDVTVSVVDDKARPLQGQLDYGLTGEFTAHLDQ